MSTTLAGVTLPDPDNPIEVTETWTGQQTEAHDGTLLSVYTNLSRLHWKLEWDLLTAAERATLRTRYEVTASQTFKPPHTATTYTVVVMRPTWQEKPRQMSSESTILYYVSFELEEAS